MSERVRKRRSMMLWAYLNFNARNVPQRDRELWCRRFLLEWASLGGKPEEVMP